MLLIKWTIVLIAFYYLYQKLVHNNLLSFSEFKSQLAGLFSNGWLLLLLVVLFTDINWLLEILKWKKLVAPVQIITFEEAYKQSLAALTVAIITPNKIGEYGAKALYFEKEDRKKILFLNFIGNGSQLAVTLFFGIIGLVFLGLHFKQQLPNFNYLHVFIGVGFMLLLTGLGWQLMVRNMKVISNLLPKGLFFSVLNVSFLRYIVFSHQFIFLLYLFNVELSYWVTINLVFCMYILASIIPSLAIFDWVIKGSIAVWLFGLVGVNELTILTITTCMWLLNSAIPALIGGIFVLNFKPVPSK